MSARESDRLAALQKRAAEIVTVHPADDGRIEIDGRGFYPGTQVIPMLRALLIAAVQLVEERKDTGGERTSRKTHGMACPRQNDPSQPCGVCDENERTLEFTDEEIRGCPDDHAAAFPDGPACGTLAHPVPKSALAFNLGGTMDRRPFCEVPPTFQGIAAHLDDPVMVRAMFAALCNERDRLRADLARRDARWVRGLRLLSAYLLGELKACAVDGDVAFGVNIKLGAFASAMVTGADDEHDPPWLCQIVEEAERAPAPAAPETREQAPTDVLNAHVDGCGICADDPFARCDEGKRLKELADAPVSQVCPNVTATCSPTCAAWTGEPCNCKPTDEPGAGTGR